MNINVAYIITNSSSYMTLVSLYSVLINNKHYDINVKIIYNNEVSLKVLDLFNLLKKQFENLKKLDFIEISTSSANLFEVVPYIKDDKFLFLNFDSLVTGDLMNLYKIDLSNNSCAAVEFFHNKDVIESLSFAKFRHVYHKPTMVLVNKTLWDKKQYSQKYSILKNKKDALLVNQTNPNEYLFNMIVDDCLSLDLKYNYSEYWFLKYSNLKFRTRDLQNKYKLYLNHIDVPCIIFFPGAKPIENGCKHSYKTLWWEYAEKSPIYNEIKDFRESNQYKLKATSAANSFDYAWLLSRMMPYIKPYLPRIIIGFLIAIPLGLLDGVTALAIKPYMDYVIGNKIFEFSIFNHSFSINSILMAILIPLGIIIFAGVQGFLRYLNSYISSWTSIHITNDVKADLFHHLIHMHPQFFDDNPSGIIISRYVTDPQTASSGIVEQIKTITTSVFGALGLIAVMIYSSWQLAFIGVFVLCMAFIPVTILRKRMRMASNQNMVITGDITTNFNETYNGNKVMYAYELQDEREKTFRTQLKEFFDVNISLTKRTAWMSPMMYQIASIGIAIVLGVGTYLINAGHMTAGAFASFVTSLLLLYKPVKTLGNTLTGIQKIFVAMGRVFELFDLKPQIADKQGTIEFKGFNDSIIFENVCFEYVPNKPVLKNINLTIKKNETLAIVGNSGGGKSTLVNLINRFYEIKSGLLKFDDTDIKDYSLNSLRGAISMVFQDNFLYSGTIKYNILMGNPNATEEDLQRAIKSAHLEEMIQKLPEGLNTSIGERGLTLSGGQRQRVAIARAMLRNAPIVILDEATSALDNESEAIVQKAMDNLMQNRTVFIIAHRLSTIKNADRIAVINDGELVELGSHDELMQIKNGQYKHLYEMQFRHQEESSL